MGWIGVDLDGTLAYYDGWKGHEHIGDPIPEMVNKVKEKLAHGKDIRIFTARAERKLAFLYINKWLREKAGLPELPVTCVKDMECEEIWDDRAKQVIKNTGKFLEEITSEVIDRSTPAGCLIRLSTESGNESYQTTILDVHDLRDKILEFEMSLESAFGKVEDSRVHIKQSDAKRLISQMLLNGFCDTPNYSHQNKPNLLGRISKTEIFIDYR